MIKARIESLGDLKLDGVDKKMVQKKLNHLEKRIMHYKGIKEFEHYY